MATLTEAQKREIGQVRYLALALFSNQHLSHSHESYPHSYSTLSLGFMAMKPATTLKRSSEITTSGTCLCASASPVVPRK